MVNLVSVQPWDAELPIVDGQCTLSATDLGPVTSIAPFVPGGKAVSTALEKALNLPLPAAGRSSVSGRNRLIWSGQGQYFLLGAEPPKLNGAVTDQSDAWCITHLSGPRAEDVLARLCPLDTSEMADGDVARSLIGHMQAVIIRDKTGFTLMVFRGFAKTLIHELGGAMASLAAQDEITD